MIAKSGSPFKAIPSKIPIALITKAKNGGNLNGKLKVTLASSFDNSLKFMPFAPPPYNAWSKIFLNVGSYISKEGLSLGRKPK